MPEDRNGYEIDSHVEGIYYCKTECGRRWFSHVESRGAKGEPTEREDAERENTERWKFFEDRLRFLASIFAIDIFDYSLLIDEIHTLLRNRPDVAQQWTKEELAYRWVILHSPELKFPDTSDGSEGFGDMRTKLSSISYFQEQFLEPVAREIHRRNRGKGRFVKPTFQWHPIEGPADTLACSVYLASTAQQAGLEKNLGEHPYSSYSRRMQGDDQWLAPLFCAPATRP
ncbi:MAG: hypothetical protein O2931_03600 [Planctomycetota bacterium]|nr:hypothetical protein [Planctomycetota bacterium]MDA1177862.1 hypothetical protein [Planctomycetota bacterium]